jgi:hypothetical protein
MTSALEEGSNMTKLVHAQIEQVLREAGISEEARMAALQNTYLGEKAEAEAKMEEYRAQTQQRIERIERELGKVSAALSVHARALCVCLCSMASCLLMTMMTCPRVPPFYSLPGGCQDGGGLGPGAAISHAHGPRRARDGAQGPRGARDGAEPSLALEGRLEGLPKYT